MRVNAMQMNKKVLIVVVAVIIVASVLSIGPSSSGESGGGLTIDKVSYSSGTVSFNGSSQEASSVRFFVTYPDGSISQYGYSEVNGHAYSGAMKLDLSKGSYNLTVFSSSDDAVIRSFEVSDITITTVVYDYDDELLRFSGTSTESSLRFFVTYPDGSISQYGSLTASDGAFSGTMKIVLPVGDYSLMVFHDSILKDEKRFSSTGSSLVSVASPATVTGLIYTGQSQTGVPSGTGYTVTGGFAADAGEHTAMLSLSQGYIWSDGTSGDRTITWSISKATLTATYNGETVIYGSIPSYPVSVTGFVNGEDASSATGYVAPTVSSSDLSVGIHELTPSGGSAANYVFAYVSGTLTVREQSAPEVHTTGISLNKSSVTIDVTDSETLSASLTPANSNDGVTWRSSNSLIVSVDQNGRLTANAYGSATITVTSGSCSATCDVKVDYAAMSMDSSTKQMMVGGTDTLTVTVPSGYSGTSVLWRTSASTVVSISGSGSTISLGGISEGSATITAIVGNLYIATCQVTVGPKPITSNTYTFFLQAPDDADHADFGSSGYSISDLRSGITLTSMGPDAGTALETVLNSEGIPCSFYTGGDLKHWVNQIFGMGDIHLSNGDWKYWIQYNNGSYNDWTLGYYTDGGSFSLIYGITSDPRSEVMVDIPDGKELIYNGSNQKGVSSNQYYTATNNEGKNVGTYKAVLKLKDSESAKYIWKDGTYSDKEIEWSIIEAHLKATYTGDVIEYGGTPALTVQVTGFVSGDSPRTIQGYQPPTVSDEGCVAVGTYTLTPSGGNPGTNYVFDYVSGSLVINRVVISEETNTNDDGSTTTTVTEKDPDSNGIIVTETTTTSTKDKDGNIIDSTEITTTNKDSDGNVTGSTEKSETVKTDKEGNIIESSTTEFVKDKDGNITSSTEGVTNYSKEKDEDGNDVSVVTVSTVSKDASGNVIENKEVSTATKSVTDEDGNTSDVRIVTETEKDAEGNVKGSTEKSETKDSDGNITERSEVLRDKDGNETYSKVEEIAPTKVSKEEGKTVTESSTKVTEKESGKTTVTEESVKEIVGADGAKETEKVREESVTDTNGSTSSKKVTEKVVEDDEAKLTSTQTESKDASGKETSEKKVVAESKDGSVKSSVEVPQDGSNAEIVTVLGSGQSGGVMSISSEQVKFAVSLQEKVSGEISDVQQEKVMLAESTTDSISLTLSGGAMKDVSDSGAALNIVSSEGALKVSKEVLGNLSGEDEVVIQFSASEEISLSEDQKDAVGENASVFEIKVMSDGESLGSSINGTLTLLVKHVAAEGMVPAMYYVADNGDMEKLEGSYDAERQEMTGITTHCSIYAVIDEDPNAGGDDVLLYAAAVAITILAVAAVAGYLYMRRS